MEGTASQGLTMHCREARYSSVGMALFQGVPQVRRLSCSLLSQCMLGCGRRGSAAVKPPGGWSPAYIGRLSLCSPLPMLSMARVHSSAG